MLVTEGNISEALSTLQGGCVYCDLETDGLNPHGGENRMVGIALTAPHLAARKIAYYFPFRHITENLPEYYIPRVIDFLNKQDMQIGWNYQFDLQFLWNEGMRHDVSVRDCMLEHHLLDENSRVYRLKPLSDKYLGPDSSAAEKELELLLQANLLDGKGDMWRLPASQVERYACDDVLLTYGMDEYHKPHLDSQVLEDVALGVGEYSRVTALMMRRGIMVDKDPIPGIIKEARTELMDMWHIARDMAGKSINLDSAQQVNRWLGVESSAAKELAKMRQTEKIKLLQRYRKLNKGISSYYNKMLEMSDEDGTLRCDMRLHGTISGRISVRNPPLQSLPTDTSLYRVKKLLVARPGYDLLQADYSQAEVKVACHYGKEMGMAAIVGSGKNMHDEVSRDLGIPRFSAKRLNFSVIYGIGAQALANDLNIPLNDAAKYLGKYHRQYPGFRRLYNECEAYAKRNGYIDMYTGRRRHYNRGYATPEHKASSNLVQGTIAEIMREKQTDMHNELMSEDVHQLLQVHDSAIMEIPEGSADRIVPMVREIMEIHNDFTLPMTVDIGVGKNLEDAK